MNYHFYFWFLTTARNSTWLHDFHFYFNLILACWIIQHKLNSSVKYNVWKCDLSLVQGSQNYWLLWIIPSGSKIVTPYKCGENKSTTIIYLPFTTAPFLIASEMPVPFWSKLYNKFSENSNTFGCKYVRKIYPWYDILCVGKIIMPDSLLCRQKNYLIQYMVFVIAVHYSNRICLQS